MAPTSSPPKRIRDSMDSLLESRGFYRKYVAKEGSNSLFRSLADLHYSSQQYFTDFLLESYLKFVKHSGYNFDTVKEYDELHGEARIVSEMLDINLKIFDSQSKSLDEYVKLPSEPRRDKPSYWLCFTPPAQYDPIFPIERIANRGMVQSILYEMLYEEVFSLKGSLEAADVMLYGEFDPQFGKPEVYDKEFRGSAMEALDRFLIPFPYKVAKALDPGQYRNIDFDVWVMSRSSSNASQRCGFYPGNLCKFSITNTENEETKSVGIYMELSKDRKHAQIYVPRHDSCIYVPKNLVEPLNHYPSSPPFEPKNEDVQSEFDLNERQRQFYNLGLVTQQDPHWLCKFDFGIPPPSPPFILQNVYPILGYCPSNNSIENNVYASNNPIDKNNNYGGIAQYDEIYNDSAVIEAASKEKNRPPNLVLSKDNHSPMITFPTPIVWEEGTCLSPLYVPLSPGVVPVSPMSVIATPFTQVFQWPLTSN